MLPFLLNSIQARESLCRHMVNQHHSSIAWWFLHVCVVKLGVTVVPALTTSCSICVVCVASVTGCAVFVETCHWRDLALANIAGAHPTACTVCVSHS